MKSEYHGIFLRDVLLLIVFTVFMWIAMLFTFWSVIASAPDMSAKIIVGVSGIALVAFATSAMLEVYMHLKRNGSHLYEEEMTNRTNKHKDEVK